MNRWEARRKLMVAAAENLAERDAAIRLLEDAAAALACGAPVSPEGLREPVRHHLRAMIELCRGARSLWSLPVNYALEMAVAIVDGHNGHQQQEVVAGGQGTDRHQPGGD